MIDKTFNNDTKIAVLALILASCLSFFVNLDMFSYLLNGDGEDIEFHFNLLTPVFIALNIGVIYAMHKGKSLLLKIVFWLYLIQIFGFEINGWGFSILMGFNIVVTWAFGNSFITINLFAALMSVLLFRSISSRKDSPKVEEV